MEDALGVLSSSGASVSCNLHPTTLSFTRMPPRLQRQPVPTQHVAGIQERSDELVSNSASEHPFVKSGYLQLLRPAGRVCEVSEGKGSVSHT